MEFCRTAAASPNSDDGVTVRVGVADGVRVFVDVGVIEGLDELVMEGLVVVV